MPSPAAIARVDGVLLTPHAAACLVASATALALSACTHAAAVFPSAAAAPQQKRHKQQPPLAPPPRLLRRAPEGGSGTVDGAAGAQAAGGSVAHRRVRLSAADPGSTPVCAETVAALAAALAPAELKPGSLRLEARRAFALATFTAGACGNEADLAAVDRAIVASLMGEGLDVNYGRPDVGTQHERPEGVVCGCAGRLSLSLSLSLPFPLSVVGLTAGSLPACLHPRAGRPHPALARAARGGPRRSGAVRRAPPGASRGGAWTLVRHAVREGQRGAFRAAASGVVRRRRPTQRWARDAAAELLRRRGAAPPVVRVGRRCRLVG
jgi:hypothetical protein